ncbi:MAG: dihydropteroate synthase [Deltaproteobacteria bacterium]|nr:dihydropteroate synthase [Deltaproteobacteria bacterium]
MGAAQPGVDSPGTLYWNFSRPGILGVLNITPDSFSDGGDYLQPDAALARAREMAAEGADLLDLGGASSHPLAPVVSVAEELRRVLPVLELLRTEIPVPISIDTQHPEVAEACLELGAALINDVSGLASPRMARLAARFRVPLVITYNNLTVPKGASGLSFLSDMLAFFDERIEEARSEGAERLILDPGYGFGKTLPENLSVLRALPQLRRFACPVLVCTSRKGSLGRLVNEPVPKERLGATLASSLFAVTRGAHWVRVHNVKAMRQTLMTWRALEVDGETVP